MGSKGQKLRSYSADERSAALKLSQEIGIAKAAGKTGIPKGTLSYWRFADKKKGHAATEVERESMRVPVAPLPVTLEAKPHVASRSKRVARLYTPSQKAEALELLQKEGPVKASRKLGISRFSLHEWNRKHQRAMAEGTADSPLAGTDEDKASKRDERILDEWKKHPGLGPSQIRNQLRRGSFKVSVRTVRMVMEEHGYVTPKVRRTESHDRRYEAVRPNQLWHMDFLQRHINKQKISVLFLVDDFSRYIPGFAMWDEDRAEAVFECFDSAVARHGRPESVMSDGGAAFWSWRGVSRFTRLLEEMGIDQIIAKVPQHNGKLEVLNANAQKELFNQERFFDLGE